MLSSIFRWRAGRNMARVMALGAINLLLAISLSASAQAESPPITDAGAAAAALYGIPQDKTLTALVRAAVAAVPAPSWERVVLDVAGGTIKVLLVYDADNFMRRHDDTPGLTAAWDLYSSIRVDTDVVAKAVLARLVRAAHPDEADVGLDVCAVAPDISADGSEKLSPLGVTTYDPDAGSLRFLNRPWFSAEC